MDCLLCPHNFVEKSLLFLHLFAHNRQIFAAQGQKHVQLELNKVLIIQVVLLHRRLVLVIEPILELNFLHQVKSILRLDFFLRYYRLYLSRLTAVNLHFLKTIILSPVPLVKLVLDLPTLPLLLNFFIAL